MPESAEVDADARSSSIQGAHLGAEFAVCATAADMETDEMTVDAGGEKRKRRTIAPELYAPEMKSRRRHDYRDESGAGGAGTGASRANPGVASTRMATTGQCNAGAQKYTARTSSGGHQRGAGKENEYGRGDVHAMQQVQLDKRKFAQQLDARRFGYEIVTKEMLRKHTEASGGMHFRE